MSTFEENPYVERAEAARTVESGLNKALLANAYAQHLVADAKNVENHIALYHILNTIHEEKAQRDRVLESIMTKLGYNAPAEENPFEGLNGKV